MRRSIQVTLLFLTLLIPWLATADSGGSGMSANDDRHFHESPMYCHSGIQVSVNEVGFAVILPQMLLAQPFPNYDNFIVTIVDPPMGIDTVTCDQVGMTIDVMVTDTSTGNSCWSEVTVEDKLDPIIECDTVRLPCTVDPFLLPDSVRPSIMSDNCTDSVDLTLTFSQTTMNLVCMGGNPYVFKIDRTWTVTDESGNSSSCTQIILFEKGDLDDIVFPADITLSCPETNTDVNVTGEPTIGGLPLANLCMIALTHQDMTLPKCGNSSVIKRVFIATDWCTAETRRDTQHIHIVDTIPPTIYCPADMTINATMDCLADFVIPNINASDLCSDDEDIDFFYKVNGVFTGNNIPGLPLGDHTITVIARDPCFNVDSCSFNVTVVDDVPPICVIHPVNISVGNSGTVTVRYDFFDYHYFDNCGLLDTMIRRVDSDCGDPNDQIFGDEITFCCNDVGDSVMIAVKIRDIQGNMNVCMVNVSVQDNIRPTINCPPSVQLDCPADTSVSMTGMPTFDDNCSAVLTWSDSIISERCPGAYSFVRTFVATDVMGNQSTCEQNIIVIDDTDPIINCPPAIVLGCAADTSPAVAGMATATDECNNPPLITYSDTVLDGSCPNTFTIIRRWTATDLCGNSSSCEQTISVEDNNPPILVCPPNMVLNCPADTSVGNTGIGTATDDCNDVIVTYSDSVVLGSCPNTFTVYRRWTATDLCDNSASHVQVLDVVDNTAPVMDCPGTMTLNCPADTAIAVTGMPTVTEECNDSVVVTHVNVVTPGACPGAFTLVRTFTATDLCGNSVSCSQTIIVVDNAPPSIMCPGDFTLNCDMDTSVVATGGPATATDLCDMTTIDVSYSSSTIPGSCPSNYTLIRTWSATDACDNTATCQQTIVVRDVQAPVITCPTSTTLACPADTSATANGMATAIDGCDNSPVISYVDNVTPGSCPNTFSIDRVWTATDNCGNASSCTQVIIVEDVLPPTITCPIDVTIDCPANTDPSNTGSATADDACNSTTITFSDSTTQGSCPNTFSVVRTWTATDPCGNSISCDQNIVVVDETPPTITCPADLTVNCDADTMPASTGMPTVMDECNNSITLTYVDVTVAGSGTVLYTITRTWMATDACGNSASCDQTIVVTDDQAPSISCPDDITAFLNPDSCQLFVTVPPPIVDDACGDVTVTNDGNGDDLLIASGIYPGGMTTVTYIATDGSGNSDTCMFTITLLDTISPAIACPGDTTVNCDDNLSPLSLFGSPTFSDNCPGVALTSSDSMINLDDCGVGTIERSFTVTDAAGNTASCTQVITVIGQSVLDSLNFIWPADTIASFDCVDFDDIPLTLPVLDPNINTCNAITVDSSVTQIVPATFGCMTFEVDYTVTDICNFDPNTGDGQWTFTQVVGIFDTIAPVINPIVQTDTFLADTLCMAEVTLPDVTASDNCNNLTITNNSLFATNNGPNASGTYPGGATDVTFYATDICGNVDSFIMEIFVTDTVRPEMVCLKWEYNIGDDLTVDLNVDTVITGVVDNCTEIEDITITYTLNDPTDTLITVGCDSVGMIFRAWIYSIDEQGNVDSCESEFGVTDQDSLCNMIRPIAIGGVVQTALYDPIMNTEVMLNLDAAMEMTNEDGNFMFGPVSSNTFHRLDADKADVYLNGVTAYDLSILFRHIAGIELLSDPYLYYAADVNEDRLIDIRDVLHIRKLLLGIDESLPIPSWTFYDAHFDLSDATNPFHYNTPDHIMVYHNREDMLDADFIGVKTADLDFSADMSLAGADTRSQQSVRLELGEGLRQDDGTVLLPIFLRSDYFIQGGQAEIKLDVPTQLVEIVPNDEFNFETNEINHGLIERNMIRLAWISEREVEDYSQPIMWLRLAEPVSHEELSWTINSTVPSEWFDANGNKFDLTLSKIKLDLMDNELEGFVLYQNEPNPFKQMTTIRFNLSEDQEYELSVYSAQGRVLHQIEGQGFKGLNSIAVSLRELGNVSGVLYYRLKTDDHRAVRKMIIGE